MTKLCLEVLEDRCCLSTFSPTAVVSQPLVTEVDVGVPNQAAFNRLLVSEYAQELKQYGVSAGSYLGASTLQDPGAGALTSSWLTNQILALWQAGKLGSTNTIMVHLDRPADDAGSDLGYNFSLTLPNGQQLVVGVSWTLPATFVSGGVTYQEVHQTVITSHEFAEAITGQQICDPLPNDEFNLIYQGVKYQVADFENPDGTLGAPIGSTGPAYLFYYARAFVDALEYFYLQHQSQTGQVVALEQSLTTQFWSDLASAVTSPR